MTSENIPTTLSYNFPFQLFNNSIIVKYSVIFNTHKHQICNDIKTFW